MGPHGAPPLGSGSRTGLTGGPADLPSVQNVPVHRPTRRGSAPRPRFWRPGAVPLALQAALSGTKRWVAPGYTRWAAPPVARGGFHGLERVGDRGRGTPGRTGRLVLPVTDTVSALMAPRSHGAACTTPARLLAAYSDIPGRTRRPGAASAAASTGIPSPSGQPYVPALVGTPSPRLTLQAALSLTIPPRWGHPRPRAQWWTRVTSPPGRERSWAYPTPCRGGSHAPTRVGTLWRLTSIDMEAESCPRWGGDAMTSRIRPSRASSNPHQGGDAT